MTSRLVHQELQLDSRCSLARFLQVIPVLSYLYIMLPYIMWPHSLVMNRIASLAAPTLYLLFLGSAPPGFWETEESPGSKRSLTLEAL